MYIIATLCGFYLEVSKYRAIKTEVFQSVEAHAAAASSVLEPHAGREGGWSLRVRLVREQETAWPRLSGRPPGPVSPSPGLMNSDMCSPRGPPIPEFLCWD